MMVIIALKQVVDHPFFLKTVDKVNYLFSNCFTGLGYQHEFVLLLLKLNAFLFVSEHFYLTDIYSPDESVLNDPCPVPSLHRREGKRPAVFLRFK